MVPMLPRGIPKGYPRYDHDVAMVAKRAVKQARGVWKWSFHGSCIGP